MLTTKQEGFVLDVFNGLTQRQSYSNNYNVKDMSQGAIDVEASLLMDNPKISQRLIDLRTPKLDETVAGLEERKRRLTEFIREENITRQGKNRAGNISASDQLNKLEGSYAPERLDVRHAIINVHIHPWEKGMPFKRIVEKEEEHG